MRPPDHGCSCSRVTNRINHTLTVPCRECPTTCGLPSPLRHSRLLLPNPRSTSRKQCTHYLDAHVMDGEKVQRQDLKPNRNAPGASHGRISERRTYLVGIGKPPARADLPDVYLPLTAGRQDVAIPTLPDDGPRSTFTSCLVPRANARRTLLFICGRG